MTSLVSELCAEVADLGASMTMTERLWALARLGILSSVLLGGAWVFFSQPLGALSLMVVVMAGIAYALLLIATHEMVHGTFLGRPDLERLLACALSWPMAWPQLTYARLHHLHHRWNGRDARDPERTDVLPHERESAGPWRRWLQDHLLPWRIVVLGGVGLIADTAAKGWQLTDVDPALARSRWLDGVGVIAVHGLMLSLAITHNVVWRYLLFWLVLERVIGAIVQFRGLVEHHGLWHSESSHLLTQLYGSRNVTVPIWLNAFFGGLPHHSAHHAFPWIPSSRLPQATARVAAVLEHHRAPELPTLNSYREAATLLSRLVAKQAR
ncbi:MAG: fatty acid desaturase family protein [Cyanobacteriota bacterium]